MLKTVVLLCIFEETWYFFSGFTDDGFRENKDKMFIFGMNYHFLDIRGIRIVTCYVSYVWHLVPCKFHDKTVLKSWEVENDV